MKEKLRDLDLAAPCMCFWLDGCHAMHGLQGDLPYVLRDKDHQIFQVTYMSV